MLIKQMMMMSMKKMEMMNIKGIGTDIVEIDRFKEAIERKGKALLDRLFTEKEQKYCNKFKDPTIHLAARFAAKESVAKALGKGFGKTLSFLDIEIINDDTGKPNAYLSKKVLKELKNPEILISISHSKTHAIAFATYC